MNHPNNLVPLAVVAVELSTTADELAARLGDAVMLDEIGIRCIPAAAARDLIATHRAAVQIARDRQRTETRGGSAAASPEGADLPALAVMMANDVEASMNASSARMDELLTGDSYFHPINEKG